MNANHLVSLLWPTSGTRSKWAGWAVLPLFAGVFAAVIAFVGCRLNVPVVLVPMANNPAATAWFINHTKLEPQNAEIVRWGDAIRTLTTNPAEQLALAQATIYRNTLYRADIKVWGRQDYMTTPTGMFAHRDAMGWKEVRDDCDGNAILNVSLLQNLGLDAKAVAGLIPGGGHIWTQVNLDGRVLNFFTAGALKDDLDAALREGQAWKAATPAHAAALHTLGLDRYGLRSVDNIPEPEAPRLTGWDLAGIMTGVLFVFALFHRLTLERRKPVFEPEGLPAR